ncbi:Putative transcriptional regulator [Photobacterium marinum]|uniref:Putative transcriptional regulator n=1 Tax=Photobacterium marinum TaxID=1056511 RepID=L8JDY2_9GAMM|nr:MULTISPECIES: nuclear transport factor 2 family protein [Photobacterium]ELR65714.1 Putative transcriptional regulator [Photobacterium marinum]
MSEQSDSSINKFVDVYSKLSKHNLADLRAIYHQDIIFEDPAHRVVGWQNLDDYFNRLFKSVKECQFEIHETCFQQDTAYVQWTMTFSHPRLSGGKAREVKGCSCLKYRDGLVIYHRDYFDLGEMLYEGIPLVGGLIRRLKENL